ncbi:hypothetical protein [Acinetobacter schindleri]|uniref:hypothetical protein n=1 Tax=Acinetobacter schindleri TaxID=108981 RepID=UPI00241C3A43|nr:hypothetical protein [Acinetobacter schindleri]
MKKNIAFINIFNGDAGGGEHYLINLIKLLQKNTHYNLYLLSPNIDNISLDFIGNKHIKINGVSKNSFFKKI